MTGGAPGDLRPPAGGAGPLRPLLGVGLSLVGVSAPVDPLKQGQEASPSPPGVRGGLRAQTRPLALSPSAARWDLRAAK